VQPSLAAKLIPERLGARPSELERDPANELARAVVFDDPRVTQLRQHLAFGAHALVVLGPTRDLDDALVPVALNEQGDRRRARAESLKHGKPISYCLASLRRERVNDLLRLRGGEFVLDSGQAVQEVRDRVRAGERVSRRRPRDELMKRYGRTVHRCGELQGAVLTQRSGELERRRGWSAAREHVERDRTQREDVESDAGALWVGKRFGRHVRSGRVVNELVDVRRSGDGPPRLRLRVKPGLPV